MSGLQIVLATIGSMIGGVYTIAMWLIAISPFGVMSEGNRDPIIWNAVKIIFFPIIVPIVVLLQVLYMPIDWLKHRNMTDEDIAVEREIELYGKED